MLRRGELDLARAACGQIEQSYHELAGLTLGHGLDQALPGLPVLGAGEHVIAQRNLSRWPIRREGTL